MDHCRIVDDNMKYKYRFVIFMCTGHWKIKAVLVGIFPGMIMVLFLSKWADELEKEYPEIAYLLYEGMT